MYNRLCSNGFPCLKDSDCDSSTSGTCGDGGDSECSNEYVFPPPPDIELNGDGIELLSKTDNLLSLMDAASQSKAAAKVGWDCG